MNVTKHCTPIINISPNILHLPPPKGFISMLNLIQKEGFAGFSTVNIFRWTCKTATIISNNTIIFFFIFSLFFH